MTPPRAPHLLALYRTFLRETPLRPLSSPSALQSQLRLSLSSKPNTSTPQNQPLKLHPQSSAPSDSLDAHLAVDQAQQALLYITAQRRYVGLLERYNPGMGMDEGERVRLTARRVGLDVPKGWSGTS